MIRHGITSRAKDCLEVSDFGWEQKRRMQIASSGSSLSDMRGAVDALERSLELDRTHAPAILSTGSAQYQREKHNKIAI
jgi:hypothetical protein